MPAQNGPTPERDRKIAALYTDGLTYDQIADRLGLTREQVRGAVERASIPRRPRGPKVPAGRTRRVIALHRDGVMTADIAADVGMSPAGVRRLLKAEGVVDGDGRLRAESATTEPLPELAVEVKWLREQAGLTKAEAAQLVGVSRQRWDQMEKGVVTERTVERIAAKLGAGRTRRAKGS